MPTPVALATLGNATETEMILFVLHHPRWPRSVSGRQIWGAELSTLLPMEQRIFKIVNNCLNTSIYSYLETSGGQSYNPYLNVVYFFQCQG
jgi:hypothetical protein